MSGWVTHGPNGKRTELVVTEDGLARDFAAKHGGRLRFCHDEGLWFAWDGAIWRRDRTGIARRLLRDFARDEAAKLGEGVRQAGRTRFIADLERFARGEAAFAATADSWDGDPWRLGTPGGTVDLATGALLAADPRDGITRATAVAPAAAADCPLWLRFLDETTGGDTALMQFLQRFFGYALTGAVTEHVLLYGHGSGGNGKSVMANTLGGLMGDYAAVAALETFTTSGREQNAGDLAMLRGARLVTAAESEGAWAQTRIKLLTGGDKITARGPRRAYSTFAPSFKLFIVGNHVPVLRHVDEATRRRFCIVPFERRPARPDRDLAAKLCAEWPAILRWMIEGCLDWRANGLARPDSVRAATADYLGGQDVVGQFLEEACEVSPAGDSQSAQGVATAGVATASALYAAWTSYAKAAGEAPGSQRAFAASLERRGFARDRTRHARLYRGIRLLETEERDA